MLLPNSVSRRAQTPHRSPKQSLTSHSRSSSVKSQSSLSLSAPNAAANSSNTLHSPNTSLHSFFFSKSPSIRKNGNRNSTITHSNNGNNNENINTNSNTNSNTNNINNGGNNIPFQSADLRKDTIKSLDQYLSKFVSIKIPSGASASSSSAATSRANILRLHLLPQLRYPISPFSNLHEFLSTSISDLNPELLLLEAKTLLNWWTELLNIVFLDYQTVSSLDRNCYYESVSRLFSHNIWLLFQINHSYSSQFSDMYDSYKSLLMKTFELAYLKINSKSLSVSMSIFIGKVFAYAFFNLNDISRGLSFLLNTKLVKYKKIFNLFVNHSFTSNPKNEYSIVFNQVLDDLKTQFPSHLTHFITSTSHPRDVNYIIESHFINSVPPPRDKINGIRETKGIWVSRWSSYDSISIFCSFFRNYLSYSSVYLRTFPSLIIDELHIYGIPGFMCFMTHISEIFNHQIRKSIAKNSHTPNKFKNFNLSTPTSATSSTSSTYNDNILIVPKISLESSIEKCFNVLRDTIFNPRNEYEKLLKGGLVKSFENIIKLIVVKTSLLDNVMVDMVMDIFTQFLKHIETPSSFSDSNNAENFSYLDWTFWLDVLVRLVDSDNLSCQVKALSTLYQIWDLIPSHVFTSANGRWILSPSEPIKLNLIYYLVSDHHWFSFFGHYMPLVRNIYNKLLIWKILGLSSIENIVLVHENFKRQDFKDESKIKVLILSKLMSTYYTTENVIFKPTDPILNKKFQIVKHEGNDDRNRDKKSRLYPFEVLDDSAYINNRSKSKISKSKSEASITSKSKFSSSSLGKDKLSKKKWMGNLFKKTSSASSNSYKDDNSSGGLSKFLGLSNRTERKEVSNSNNIASNSSMSSVSSSFSSLELNSVDANSTLEVNDQSHSIDYSKPPEWTNNTDIANELWEFKLLRNDSKIKSYLSKLNQINDKDAILKYSRDNDEILIINEEPRLPRVKITKKNDYLIKHDMESVESLIDDEIGDDDIIDLQGGFDDFEGLGSFDLNNNKHDPFSTGTIIYHDGINDSIKNVIKNTPASQMYLANGILEYNEEVKRFETFMQEKCNNILSVVQADFENSTTNDSWDHESNTALSKSSSSLLEIKLETNFGGNYRITNSDYENLKKQIPSIVPELGTDKVNAF